MNINSFPDLHNHKLYQKVCNVLAVKIFYETRQKYGMIPFFGNEIIEINEILGKYILEKGEV